MGPKRLRAPGGAKTRSYGRTSPRTRRWVGSSHCIVPSTHPISDRYPLRLRATPYAALTSSLLRRLLAQRLRAHPPSAGVHGRFALATLHTARSCLA
jgi:hypothetical protein